MIKIVDGKPVHVPDDETITPQHKELRTMMNAVLGPMLDAAAKDMRENGPITQAYRKGVLSRTDGFDWYFDPKKPQ